VTENKLAQVAYTGSSMNPKKRALFLGTTFALMAPYLGFAVYQLPRFPPGQVPNWVINTIGVWFCANFLILYLVVMRLRKK